MPERSRRRRVALVVVGLLVLAVGGGYAWQRPLLLTGTGYAAHNACALTAVAGRGNPDADLPPNPLVPVLRTASQSDGATSSILGVLASQTTWASDGFGCTLADRRPDLPEPTTVTAAHAFVDAPAPGLGEALDHAYGATSPRPTGRSS